MQGDTIATLYLKPITSWIEPSDPALVRKLGKNSKPLQSFLKDMLKLLACNQPISLQVGPWRLKISRSCCCRSCICTTTASTHLSCEISIVGWVSAETVQQDKCKPTCNTMKSKGLLSIRCSSLNEIFGWMFRFGARAIWLFWISSTSTSCVCWGCGWGPYTDRGQGAWNVHR